MKKWPFRANKLSACSDMSNPFPVRDRPALLRCGALVAVVSVLVIFCLVSRGLAEEAETPRRSVLGLTGKVNDVTVAVPARAVVTPGEPSPARDLDLKRMEIGR